MESTQAKVLDTLTETARVPGPSPMLSVAEDRREQGRPQELKENAPREEAFR